MLVSGLKGSNPVVAWIFGVMLLVSGRVQGQDDKILDEPGLKPVPVLTGSTAYFTRVTGGQVQDAPSLSPLLLLPLGDRWLIQGKGSLSDNFAKNAQGDYTGVVSYGLSYAEADYITRYVTVSAGR